MRSLEIRTERIFNNLIKQNQKLAADFVLKQSKIVSSAQSPTSSVRSPEYSALSPASSVQSSVSIVQLPEFSVQGSESNVQSPASRVQRPTLASWVQEFRYAVFNLILNIFRTLATISNVDFEQLNVRLVVNETCHTETKPTFFL